MVSVGARIDVQRCCVTTDSGENAYPSYWFSLRKAEQLKRDNVVAMINQARGDILQASADPKDPRGVLLSSELVTHLQIPDLLCAVIKGVNWHRKYNGIYAIKKFHGDPTTLGVWLWCSQSGKFVIKAAVNIDLDLLGKVNQCS